MNTDKVLNLTDRIRQLEKDLDEADKEVCMLKAENSKLNMLGTQREVALVWRLIHRIRKYEPEFDALKNLKERA